MIYTEKKELKDWILQNDLYFNLNTGNEEMSENEINLIQQVDEAKLTPDKRIETKYGLGTIRNLSSGCKTLLNIVKHPDKVVGVEECGPNVLKFIFAMDNIKIYMSRPSLADIPDDAMIVRIEVGDDDEDGGDGLGKDGGKRRAPNAEIQGKDEQRVQKDVEPRANEGGFHADGGEALRGDEGVHAQCNLDKHGAQRVDPHIVQRIADGVLAGTEEIKDRVNEYE